MTYGRLEFENRFGKVRLELRSDYKPVSELGRVKELPSDLHITLEQAEQIVLITDNRGIQIVPNFPDNLRQCAVVSHKSASVAAWVKVAELTYTGPEDASQAIRDASRPAYI